MAHVDHIEIVPGLQTLLERCVGLKAGEKVLILTDSGMDDVIIETVGVMCRDRGAEVTITNMVQVAIPGSSPTSLVAAAAREADVVLELGKQFVGASKARVDACAAGARWLILCAMNRALLREHGAINADYAAIRPVAELVIEKISQASTFRFLGRSGTDVSGSIAGRRGRGHFGIANAPGMLAAPPDVEVGFAPIEGSANGVIYADCPILMGGPERVLEDPVRLTVRDGNVVEIEGRYGYLVRDLIDASGDPRMFNLAEVAIGMNPLARLSGIPVESEAALGTGHVGLGNSIGYFGTVDAVGHLDLVLADATLYLDEECIVREGEFLLGELPGRQRIRPPQPASPGAVR